MSSYQYNPYQDQNPWAWNAASQPSVPSIANGHLANTPDGAFYDPPLFTENGDATDPCPSNIYDFGYSMGGPLSHSNYNFYNQNVTDMNQLYHPDAGPDVNLDKLEAPDASPEELYGHGQIYPQPLEHGFAPVDRNSQLGEVYDPRLLEAVRNNGSGPFVNQPDDHDQGVNGYGDWTDNHNGLIGAFNPSIGIGDHPPFEDLQNAQESASLPRDTQAHVTRGQNRQARPIKRLFTPSHDIAGRHQSSKYNTVDQASNQTSDPWQGPVRRLDADSTGPDPRYSLNHNDTVLNGSGASRRKPSTTTAINGKATRKRQQACKSRSQNKGKVRRPGDNNRERDAGEIKWFDGKLYHQLKTELEWYPAVKHADIWHLLLCGAKSLSSYLIDQPKGITLGDETAPVVGHETWGPDRANRPAELFMLLEPEGGVTPACTRQRMMFQKRRVIDRHGKWMYNWDDVPVTISSMIDGATLEALKRRNPELTNADLQARMMDRYRFTNSNGIVEERYKPLGSTALNNRAMRFRRDTFNVTWKVVGRGSDPHWQWIRKTLPRWCLDSNSTDGYRDPTTNEKRQLNAFLDGCKFRKQQAAQEEDIQDEDQDADFVEDEEQSQPAIPASSLPGPTHGSAPFRKRRHDEIVDVPGDSDDPDRSKVPRLGPGPESDLGLRHEHPDMNTHFGTYNNNLYNQQELNPGWAKHSSNMSRQDASIPSAVNGFSNDILSQNPTQVEQQCANSQIGREHTQYSRLPSQSVNITEDVRQKRVPQSRHKKSLQGSGGPAESMRLAQQTRLKLKVDQSYIVICFDNWYARAGPARVDKGLVGHNLAPEAVRKQIGELMATHYNERLDGDSERQELIIGVDAGQRWAYICLEDKATFRAVTAPGDETDWQQCELQEVLMDVVRFEAETNGLEPNGDFLASHISQPVASVALENTIGQAEGFAMEKPATSPQQNESQYVQSQHVIVPQVGTLPDSVAASTTAQGPEATSSPGQTNPAVQNHGQRASQKETACIGLERGSVYHIVNLGARSAEVLTISENGEGFRASLTLSDAWDGIQQAVSAKPTDQQKGKSPRKLTRHHLEVGSTYMIVRMEDRLAVNVTAEAGNRASSQRQLIDQALNEIKSLVDDASSQSLEARPSKAIGDGEGAVLRKEAESVRSDPPTSFNVTKQGEPEVAGHSPEGHPNGTEVNGASTQPDSQSKLLLQQPPRRPRASLSSVSLQQPADRHHDPLTQNIDPALLQMHDLEELQQWMPT